MSERITLVIAQEPVQLSVLSVPGDDLDADTKRLIVHHGNRVIGRSICVDVAADLIAGVSLFSSPVKVGLFAQVTDSDGVDGLVTLLLEPVTFEIMCNEVTQRHETLSLERILQHYPPGYLKTVVPLPYHMVVIGRVERPARSRAHPDNLGDESRDMLMRLLYGQTYKTEDQRIVEDLLGTL